jgi:hypothetical protein
MIDPAVVGTEAMKLMEGLELHRMPADAEIAEVMVIVACAFPVPDVDEDDAGGSAVFYRCTSARPWVQKGLVKQVADSIDRNEQRWPA